MATRPGDLDALRARIDAIDRDLVALLDERAACVLAIGRVKHDAGLAVYQPARESAVLENVRRANHGPLDDDAVARLFERIIDEARRLERNAAGGDDPEPPPDGGTVEST